MGSAAAGMTMQLLKAHYDEFVALNPIRLILHGKKYVKFIWFSKETCW